MFPSPKPVAPLRSISSKKKVSSVKMGFVNTWSRYLDMERIQVSGYCTDSAWFFLLCFTATYPSWDQMQERGKNAFSSLHSFCNSVSYLLFPLDPDSNEGSWCKLVSRRMPCCARIWGLCPASSISCCFPTCHATKQV